MFQHAPRKMFSKQEWSLSYAVHLQETPRLPSCYRPQEGKGGHPAHLDVAGCQANNTVWDTNHILFLCSYLQRRKQGHFLWLLPELSLEAGALTRYCFQKTSLKANKLPFPKFPTNDLKVWSGYVGTNTINRCRLVSQNVCLTEALQLSRILV